MSSSVGLFMRWMLFTIILILIIISISPSRPSIQSLSYQEDSVHFPPELMDPALLAEVTFHNCKMSTKSGLRDPTCKEVCISDALLVGFPDFLHKWVAITFLWNWRYTCTFSVVSRHFYQLFGHGNNFPYWETLLIFCNKIFYCICQGLHSQKCGRKSNLKTAQNWMRAMNRILPKFCLHQVVSFKPSPSPRVEEVKPFVPITKVFIRQDCLKGPKNQNSWEPFT